MKGLRIAAALAAALVLTNCAQLTQGLRIGFGVLEATHRLVGYVCEPAEDVHDAQGILWGVRFIAAAVGTPCDTGGRQINVAAALANDVERARELEVGQSVEIEGDLAEREVTPRRLSALSAASASPAVMNEPIYARSIRPGKRK